MDTWPTSLQQLLNADSFQLRFGDNRIRTEMDVGPAKVRARATDATDQYNCSILLDYDQYSDFRDFYKITLGGGVRQFLFNDPMIETPTPVAFRFVEPPDIRPLGGRVFQVSMVWEKLPTNV